MKEKTTGTTASIFIFDKKSLEPRSSGLGGRSSSSTTKKLHEDVIERLKREASNLARLRHPSVLQVLEPMEETRGGGLMFATEQITTSLAGLLQEKDAQEGNSRIGSRSGRFMIEEPDGARRRRDIEIDELEIQKGLLQVAKGLEFLHESAGLVHGNLNPEAIFINAKSDWKISGLGFAGPSSSSNSRSSLSPLALSEALYQDPRLPPFVQLNLDYTSPDFALDSNVTTSADLFSLGIIILSIYNSPHVSPLQAHSNLSTYKKIVTTPSSTPSQANNFLCSGTIPIDLATHVLPRLITRRPAQRLTAKEFQQSQYFDNILVSTIRFLESLPAKNQNEKSQFMRGLQRVISEFPVSVLERKVLVALLDELKDRELLSLTLQNIFAILKRIPNVRRTLPEKVIPHLKEVFPTGKSTAQDRDPKKDAGLMVVLDNMKVVAAHCSGKDFKEDILPLIRLGLDSHTHSLADGAIKCLPVILPVLDFSTVKNEVFPPIASTFSRTNSLAIKVRCLEAFTVLCGGSVGKEELTIEDDLSGMVQKSKPQSIKSSILDKYTIQEKLVPSLKAIKTKEPAVMMAALSVFRQVGIVADTDFLALEVLPILWSFSLGPLLDLRQFGEFMNLIRSISSKIEREQTKKLQELSSGTDSSGFNSGLGGSSATSIRPTHPDADSTRDNFERLVLGPGTTTSIAKDVDPWGDMVSGAPNTQASSQKPSSAAFPWSTNVLTPSGRGETPSSFSVRSITPDYNLNSFPPLEPNARQKSPPTPVFSLQPIPSTMWSASTSANSQPLIQGKSMSGSSVGSLSNMHAIDSSTTGSKIQSIPNYSAFSIPPPPSSQASLGNSSVGGNATHAAFSSNNGLDKYESLL
ncbi:kinase-like domain-containing protein [Aspergillus avenaceus]|uniref:Kinase-like domain-containing protein n=1 Tax=Aspergillus avenaceus TaxID=36643 RepID=A0A5N6TIS5_ASPAV|nr:kinase-like domain-containing protein [Aspergillus avenaceus]